jgi:hypothetical protein
MPRNVIVNLSTVTKINDIKLMNGDILLVSTGSSDTRRIVPLLVSSYIPSDMDSDEAKHMGLYCSLVNLETGGKSFAQPLLRKTDYKTIADMLSGSKHLGYTMPHHIKHVAKDKYDLNLNILE